MLYQQTIRSVFRELFYLARRKAFGENHPFVRFGNEPFKRKIHRAYQFVKDARGMVFLIIKVKKKLENRKKIIF